ncbi:MAG TPA: hypothetical protein VJ846_10145 [Sphingomicrobium sp.]|nr:hypothetical protein [Sphingomicrobium sp.]
MARTPHHPAFSSQSKAVSYVLEAWPKASRVEAEELIDIIESIPSTSWSSLMGPAHKGSIANADLLLQHQDRIYEQIAYAAAEEDGLTSSTPKK